MIVSLLCYFSKFLPFLLLSLSFYMVKDFHVCTKPKLIHSLIIIFFCIYSASLHVLQWNHFISTLLRFHSIPFSFGSFMFGTGSFLFSFLGSLSVGVITALIVAIMLKFTHLYRYPSLESCLVTLLAYTCFFLSNAVGMSGIVSLLFCGITLKHYASDNMGKKGKRTLKYMFRVLSQITENL